MTDEEFDKLFPDWTAVEERILAAAEIIKRRRAQEPVKAKIWEPCSWGCRGWLHSSDPFEVQKCDACARFKSDDEAREVHKKECEGCRWPDIDYQDACMSWIQDLVTYDLESPDKKASPYYDEIMELHGYCEERGVEFMDGVPHAIQTCVNAIDKCVPDSPPMHRFGGLLNLLKRIRDGIEKEELKIRDFSNWEDIAL